jgi:hypothetical protein
MDNYKIEEDKVIYCLCSDVYSSLWCVLIKNILDVLSVFWIKTHHKLLEETAEDGLGNQDRQGKVYSPKPSDWVRSRFVSYPMGTAHRA